MTNIITGQTAIAATGTLQQLPTSGRLLIGVHISCPSTNAKPVAVTAKSSGSAAVDGTGNSFIVSPGNTSVFFPVPDVDALYVGGTAADVVSWSAS